MTTYYTGMRPLIILDPGHQGTGKVQLCMHAECPSFRVRTRTAHHLSSHVPSHEIGTWSQRCKHTEQMCMLRERCCQFAQCSSLLHISADSWDWIEVCDFRVKCPCASHSSSHFNQQGRQTEFLSTCGMHVLFAERELHRAVRDNRTQDWRLQCIPLHLTRTGKARRASGQDHGVYVLLCKTLPRVIFLNRLV